ncbi:unnamed protein product [Trichobilharzia regenti]|nr:unnamed protein product [Trichobilharzia regenti]
MFLFCFYFSLVSDPLASKYCFTIHHFDIEDGIIQPQTKTIDFAYLPASLRISFFPLCLLSCLIKDELQWAFFLSFGEPFTETSNQSKPLLNTVKIVLTNLYIVRFYN